MALSPQQVDDITSAIMDDVRARIAGTHVIDGRVHAQELGSLRDKVRGRLARTAPHTTARADAVAITVRPLPWWLTIGFALSLMGGLMGFVGAAKSYEVARTQSGVASRLDALQASGAMERVERAGAALQSGTALDQIAELQAFRARATQAVRDLAELQEQVERLRRFE